MCGIACGRRIKLPHWEKQPDENFNWLILCIRAIYLTAFEQREIVQSSLRGDFCQVSFLKKSSF